MTKLLKAIGLVIASIAIYALMCIGSAFVTWLSQTPFVILAVAGVVWFINGALRAAFSKEGN